MKWMTYFFLTFFLIVVPVVHWTASFAVANPSGFTIEAIENVQLNSAMTYFWEKERPQVQRVALVTAKVDAKLLTPREGFEPLFFINDRVAEKVKVLDDGRVVFISPEPLFHIPDLWVSLEPYLPENMDRTKARQLYENYQKKYAVDRRTGRTPRESKTGAGDQARAASTQTSILLPSVVQSKKKFIELSEEQLYERAQGVK